MKTRKFKVNLKSCAGTFFYSHVVLIFGGLFFFCFIFMMDERKKYCQPGVYILCFCFSYFIGPLMILSKLSGASLLQKSLARAHLSASLTPCILIYRMVGYYFFSSQHDLIFGHIWPLEIMFRPHLACILVQCWQHSPCWTYQVEKWVGCIWDNSAKWRLHSGLFSRALFCCTETEESLALACSEAGPNSSLPSL